MKKINLLVFVLLTALASQAQQLSFGPVIGFNAYDIEIDGPLVGGGAVSGLNVGGFVDYQIQKGFGVRGVVSYNSIKENQYALSSGNQFNVLFEDADLNTLQLHGLLRLDTDGQYNKGFYLIGGFRMVNVLSTKVRDEDVQDFYKQSNFGALFGFGVTISRRVGLELMGDANLTSPLSNDAKARNYGIYGNLTVDLASFFKTK